MREQPRQRDARDDADRKPGAELDRALSENVREHLTRGRSERATHADLARAPSDRERHDAVETRGGERKRNEPECREALRDHALGDRDFADHLRVVAHPVERRIGVGGRA